MASKSKKEKNIIFTEEHVDEESSNGAFADTKPSMVENIISVILGLAVVVVIGAMVVNVIKNRNNPSQPPTAAETEKGATTSGTMYTVQNGDTLWSIAQKFYNDGDAWPQIQKTNNLTTTDLENGTVLTIPTISNASPSPEVNTSVSSSDASPTGPTGTSPTGPTGSSPTGPTGSSPTGPTGMIEDGPTGATGIELTQQGQTSSASTDRQYTVVEGDSLWDICVNRYNDGYRWVQVAQMNNLQNPNLIFTGTTLLMP